MSDDLEKTQSYFAPQTQEELDEMLSSMGANRPTRTIGATLSPTLRDELGNPVPIDAQGNPIYFQANPDYDPDAKPSLANAKKNIGEMASGAMDFLKDPIGGLSDMGRNAVQAGSEFVERTQTGNTTLGDVFGVVTTMMGAGPATSIATKGLRATGEDLANPNMSRIFLTPETPNLSEKQRVAYLDAQNLAAQGTDPLTIKQQTGWENLAGREWVFEIDDSKAETRESALLNNATRDVEFNVPGGSVSGQQRRGLLLQAQRDIIGLKKQLREGAITEDEFADLSAARQRALDTELGATTEASTITKQVPLAPSLKTRGSLEQTFYHPELGNYVPSEMAEYRATVGALKGRSPNVLGDHDKRKKVINAYRKDDAEPMKSPGINDRRGTMVHEVQHMVDDASNSAGSGFNKSRSAAIRNEAANRHRERLRNFEENKLQDTVDTMDIFVFGQKLNGTDLTRMVEDSIVYDSAAGRGLLDEELLKAVMQEEGFTDVDLTFRSMKEGRPDVYRSLQELSGILSSRDRQLSEMSDFDIYEYELGEVKARLADRRSRMDPAERANSLATDDIRRSNPNGPGLPVDLSLIFTPNDYKPGSNYGNFSSPSTTP